MNDNFIEIKEQRKNIFVVGLSLLACMIISLTVALFPYLSEFAMKYAIAFFVIGGIAFIVFTTMFVFLLYKECNPDNALILTSNGFTDINNIGNDIEIEWTNVSSVKMLGKGTIPFLGIVLENSDIVMARMKKNVSDKMRKNIEDGLPAILISQSDVRMPIKDLRDIFIKFVREARYLQNDTTKKTKTNPFSTDDVLRAFGKLPKEEPKNVETNSNDTPAQDDNNTDSFYDSVREAASETEEPVLIEEEPDDDSKYESHGEAPLLIYDTADEVESTVEDDDMPEEIKEILGRARSSKISELGKILSEDDIPFSLSRVDNPVSEQNTEPVEEVESENEEAPIEVSKEEAYVDATPDPEILIPKDIHSDKNDDVDEMSFEHQLDSMIKSAFEKSDKEQAEKESRAKESLGSEGDFYPDLVLISDSDFEDEHELDAKGGNAAFEDDSLFGGFITSIDDD